jgi:hypothetical protein
MTPTSNKKRMNTPLVVALIAFSGAIIAALIPNWNSLFHNGPQPKNPLQEVVCNNLNTLLPYIQDDFSSIKEKSYFQDSITIWYKSKLGFAQMKSSVCETINNKSYYFDVLIYDGDSTECLKQYKNYVDYINSCYATSTKRNYNGNSIDFIGESYDIRLQMYSTTGETYMLHLFLYKP